MPIPLAAETGTVSPFLAFLRSPWGILLCWLLLINLVTFLVFGVDKWKAKRKERHKGTRRVPERTLLLLSVIGGSVGGASGDEGLPPQDPAPFLPHRHPGDPHPADHRAGGAVGLLPVFPVSGR